MEIAEVTKAAVARVPIENLRVPRAECGAVWPLPSSVRTRNAVGVTD